MTVHEYGDPSAKVRLVQPVDDHDLSLMDNQITAIKRLTDREFSLMAIGIGDWNNELSPWRAPAVFGKEDFGGRALETLKEILKLCRDERKVYMIGGYSLAGLFSLWAAYQTDRFEAVAAASPSVWFPGFTEYMKESKIRTRKVYLSLGDKEEKTKNPVVATVGDNIRMAAGILSTGQKDFCILEWNEGNHFRESDLRCAKAFAGVLESTKTI